MAPYGYKPPSSFSSFIPSAQLSSSPRTHFNTTVRWISHSSITTLSRRTHANILILLRKTRLFQKHLLRPRRFPSNSSLPERLSLKPSSLNPSSSTTTSLFLPNELLDQLFQDPALNHMDILAIRSICRTLYPSATREYTHRRSTFSAVRRLSLFWNLNNTSTIMPFPLIMSRELSDEMRFAFGKSCLYIKRLGVMGRGYIEKMGELR